MLNIPLKTVWENETDRRAETFSQITRHYSQPVRELFPKARANVEGIYRHMVKIASTSEPRAELYLKKNLADIRRKGTRRTALALRKFMKTSITVNCDIVHSVISGHQSQHLLTPYAVRNG